MATALESRVDWTQNGLFHGIPDYLVPEILLLSWSNGFRSTCEEFEYLMIRRDVDNSPDPKGVVKGLTPEPAQLIVANWKFAHVSSESWVQEQNQIGSAFGDFWMGRINQFPGVYAMREY